MSSMTTSNANNPFIPTAEEVSKRNARRSEVIARVAKLTDEGRFGRGISLLLDSKVVSVEREKDGGLHGVVISADGSRSYHVQGRLMGPGKRPAVTCSCLDKNPCCKHTVAVLASL
jgi:uncharacterized Zn finger protein